MKRILFLTLLVVLHCPVLCAALETNPYTRQAQQWVKQYIGTDKKLLVDPQDVQQIANLLYFSYYRSKITLDAQQCAIDTLNSVWQSYENITYIRMNPSHDIPHAIDASRQKELLEQFLRLTTAHRTIGKTYAQAAELMVNGNALLDAHSLKAIQTLRADARNVVGQALYEIKQILGDLYYSMRTQTQDLCELMLEQDETISRSFSFVNYIMSYIPQLAIQSFVEADKLNNTVSQEGWKAFQMALSVSTLTWEAIERARGSFYQAYYKALYEVVKTLDSSYQTIVYGEDGQVSAGKDTILLPAPEQLP